MSITKERSIEMNEIRWGRKRQEINWNDVQKFYDLPSTWKKTKEEFNLHNKQMSDAVKQNLLKTRDKSTAMKLVKPHLHSKETKIKLSVIQRNYLLNNPDKHPWRKNSKFVSKPCEHLKSILKQRGVDFIEEFQSGNGRNYSIDILIRNIAIEVNGNQHYSKDGNLKPYYIERENFLKSIGYDVINVHYSKVFDDLFVNNLVRKLVPPEGIEPPTPSLRRRGSDPVELQRQK